MTDTEQATIYTTATSRDAVLAALNHRESRLVPFDLGSTKVTSICSRAYRGLGKALGVDVEPVRIANVNGQLPDIAPRLLEAAGASCVGIEPYIDNQHVLPFGSPGEVRQEVLRHLDNLAPGGGYVAAAVHNIQDGMPPENVTAMVEAIREFGWT